MARNMIQIGLVVFLVLLLSKQHVEAQVSCDQIVIKLINCESFLFGYSNVPGVQCCASAQDVVQQANASKEVLKATCRCLKAAAQAMPVNLSNAAQLTQSCNLNLNIPISPSVDCDSL
uniref:non-specific lipid-transfer protein-like n=1 Tax=Erigeron canadensis TaxID=72917 RepID=UPI001CB9731E|nr:non-specific lipid-transfer protein-like [Erigeron canadensis]